MTDHPLDNRGKAKPVPRRTRLVSVGRQTRQIPGAGRQPNRVLECEGFWPERNLTQGVWIREPGRSEPVLVQSYTSEPDQILERFTLRRQAEPSGRFPTAQADTVTRTPTPTAAERAAVDMLFGTVETGGGDTVSRAVDEVDW